MDTVKLSTEHTAKIKKYIEGQFDGNVVPALKGYIEIPNLSRNFDPEWNTNGKLEQCADYLFDWVKKQDLKNTKAEIIQEKGRTPLIFIEVDGSTKGSETVVFYGHFDKQPWFTGWREGLGPITPVIEGNKLYGRGVVDDGYAIFGAVLAVKTLQEHSIPHPRCIIFIEGDEESGSFDLPFYFDLLAARIGKPKILISLDSGCPDYERLYMVSNMRGILNVKLNVKMLEEGVHSGDASGVVPDTFRIVRMLLDRIEDPKTGIVHRDFHVNIPGDRYKQAEDISSIIGKKIQTRFPLTEGAKIVDQDPLVTLLNRSWLPQLSCTGIDGLPPTNKAGNVLRPETNIALSLRLPPTLDVQTAEERLTKLLESDPPYGSKVTVTSSTKAKGWNAPPSQKYLDDIIQSSSINFFDNPSLYFGQGGTIPFIEYLYQKFPEAQFVITGVSGPQSNAHGPNESLDLPYTKKFLCCITQILAEVYPHLKN